MKTSGIHQNRQLSLKRESQGSRIFRKADRRSENETGSCGPIVRILKKKPCNGMCSCFYLRLSKQLLGGLGVRLADEVSDMIVRIKRGLSRCCYHQPPEPPGTRRSYEANSLRAISFTHFSQRC